MFGLQASALIQQLRGVKSFDELASKLAGIIGDCERELEHRGPVTFTGTTNMDGPTVLGGTVTGPNGGPVNITVQNSTNSQQLGGQTLAQVRDATLLTNLLTAIFNSGFYSEATLGADLNSGSTVDIDDKTYNAKFVVATYKLVDTCVVGAIWNGTDYSIIAWSKCEVLQ